jgi:3-phosphoshikimate 1-carboxyvinyltransferase
VAVRASTLRLPADFAVPGDPSSAAFFLCAAAILPGSDVTVERTLLNPTRIGFLEVLRRMGAAVEVTRQGEEPEPWGRVRVGHGPGLTATTIRAGEVPLLIDEIPILALVASQAQGVSVFEGVGELRLKESDRLQAMAGQLGLMGADLRVLGERLVVAGPSRLQAPDRLDSGDDHRVAMTLRLAGLAAQGWPEIQGEACAAISYPEFQAHLQGLRR